MNKIAIVLHKTSKCFHIMGCTIIFFVMFFTTADVILRYFFSRPILGGHEITQTFMGLVIAFGLAFSQVEKRHIRVEILFNRFPQKIQYMLNIIIGLLCLGILVLMTWQNVIYVKTAFVQKFMTASLHIPRLPFIAVLSFGLFLFSLIILIEILDNMMRLVKK